jgi:hypothetical protein
MDRTRPRGADELLKHPQYTPFHFVDQVISMFAGTKGYLDDVPAKQVATFEVAMLNYSRRWPSRCGTPLAEGGVNRESCRMDRSSRRVHDSGLRPRTGAPSASARRMD